MAESIRELVVTLSLEAGTFSKTCSDINSQIKGVEAEFNAITTGVDSWKTTIEGRKAKLDALTETFGLQQTKITTIATELGKANTALAADPGNLGAAKKVSSLETQLNNAKTAAALTKAEIEKLNQISLTALGTKLTNFGSTLNSFGRKFSLYIGGPLVALGIKSFNLAQDYETAMSRLQIATGGTEETMASLDAQVLSMTSEIPMTYVELTDLMTRLAQAGVPIENLKQFTAAMAGLGATTDVGAVESAQGVMQFLTVLNESPEKVGNMASALLVLGNNSVSTGAEIFAMAQRMAGMGNLAGLNAPEILSLAAAFSSMGINAEAGGTAAAKLMKEFALAAETGKGAYASVEQISAVMKVSTTDFTTMWAADPAATMVKFFDGLATGAADGNTSVLAMLDSLGLTEARLSNLIAVAASNPDFFSEMLATGTAAWEDNTAAAEATTTAYSTSESQTALSMNAIENASADMGTNVVDAVQPIIDTIADLATEFGKLDEATQSNWVKVAGALVLLGPAAIGIGGVAKGIGEMIGHLVKLDANGVSNWSKLIGYFNSPFGAGVLAAVAIGGSIYVLDQYLTSISGNTTNIISGLKNIEIGLDETKYKAVTDALAQVQAQADALSGKTGEYNQNVSVAVKAGYGTESMYGTALGYESLLTEQEIASIAGQYAAEVDRLNSAIGAAKTASEQAALATERNRVQAKWDTDVEAAKQYHMNQVSALVAGMMAADPEAKVALEQAAKDYDVVAALTKAQADVMKDGVTPAQTDAIWKNFFTPEIMKQYFAGIKYEDLVPGTAALDLENKIVTGLSNALKTAGGENSLANTLLQSILDNPLTADTFDATKTSGALDGIIELLDFKAAGEKAGTEYGGALTTGLADGLTTGTETATTAGTVMATAVDASIADPLGIQSPSTVMRQHGLDIGLGLQLGILDGLPLAAAAMNVLGAALTAIASAQGTSAGAAYGSAFSSAASVSISLAIDKLNRELNKLSIRINSGYGNTGR